MSRRHVFRFWSIILKLSEKETIFLFQLHSIMVPMLFGVFFPKHLNAISEHLHATIFLLHYHMQKGIQKLLFIETPGKRDIFNVTPSHTVQI